MFKFEGEIFMAKRNNLFAKLIQEAKERLKEGNYKQQNLKQKVKRHLMIEENKRKNQETMLLKPNVTFSLFDSEERDKALTKKIVNILSDGSLHMLNEFIDEQEFENLDDIGKERYILEFSAKYNKICEHYYKQII